VAKQTRAQELNPNFRGTRWNSSSSARWAKVSLAVLWRFTSQKGEPMLTGMGPVAACCWLFLSFRARFLPVSSPAPKRTQWPSWPHVYWPFRSFRTRFCRLPQRGEQAIVWDDGVFDTTGEHATYRDAVKNLGRGSGSGRPLELALADWLEELAVYGTARILRDQELAYQLSLVMSSKICIW
jgi:hypothetical protein